MTIGLNLNNYFATSETVGEWDNPSAAADGFNRIVRAIAARIEDDFRAEDRMADAVHAAWDMIGSDESLPEMTRERAAEIAERVV